MPKTGRQFMNERRAKKRELDERKAEILAKLSMGEIDEHNEEDFTACNLEGEDLERARTLAEAYGVGLSRVIGGAVSMGLLEMTLQRAKNQRQGNVGH